MADINQEGDEIQQENLFEGITSTCSYIVSSSPESLKTSSLVQDENISSCETLAPFSAFEKDDNLFFQRMVTFLKQQRINH